MNKLLLLALLGFVIIAIADENNPEKNKDIENIQNRDIREAGKKDSTYRKEKPKKKKSGRITKKGKNKRKSNKTKKSAKKGKRKSQTKKGGKSKKTRKHKLRKNKSKSSRKNSKSKRKGKKSAATSRDSTCLSFLCIDDAVAYLKLLKDRAANHEKQHSRVQRQNNTGSSKAGKKGLFGPVVRRIVENGGGNASDLKCNGATNAGSAQLTNLTETLLKCEDEIHNACHPTNLPQTNMTQVKICNEAIDYFKTTTAKCIKLSGAAACACWTDETLARDAAIIKKCDCK